MFKGATFGTRFREAHAYREPDTYPTEMNHDVTIDSDASIRGMPPPVSSRPQGPPPTVPVRPTPEQQRIIQLETMVNTLQARLDAAPDRARVPDPMTTPETLVT